MLESSLIKLHALRAATLLKKDSNTSILLCIMLCIHSNFVNCSKTPILCRGCMNGWLRLFMDTFFNRTFPVVASDSFRFPPAAFLKKGLQQRRFSVRFAKFLRTSFYKTPPGDCFLCLPVILRSFSDHPLF